jgi:hypothetical protein
MRKIENLKANGAIGVSCSSLVASGEIIERRWNAWGKCTRSEEA